MKIDDNYWLNKSELKKIQPFTMLSNKVLGIKNSLANTSKSVLDFPKNTVAPTLSTDPQTFPLNTTPISEGPRTISLATNELKILLEQLALVAPNEAKLTLDASGDWLLDLPENKQTNLSLLMRHANLSHLALSDDIINQLAKFVPILNDAIYVLNNIPTENVFAHLPSSLVSAIRFYTSSEYTRFNAFWRGEPDETISDHQKNIQDQGLQLFLIGVFINTAIDRIPNLLSTHEECRDMMLPTELTLHRSEHLNQNEQVRLRRGLQAITPLMSTSYKGRPNLKITNASNYTVSVESISVFTHAEAEVLLSNHSVVEWGAIVNGKRTGKIVNTPDIDVASRYPVAKALSSAYRNHYSKQYNEVDDDGDTITINGIRIPRPVHALAHITECLVVLPSSIALFAEHAISDEMRAYCKNMSDQEFEFLSILVVYKNTGRESEVSFTSPKYDDYKNASAENFVKYAKQYTTYTDAQIAEGRELIRERGNPNYKSNDPIMQFRVRILNINHDLDLRRLFSEYTTDSALNQHLPLLQDTDAMRADFKRVKAFAAACIEAMGEMGMATDRQYHPPFHIFSTRVGVADELLNHRPAGIPSEEGTKLFVQVIRSFSNTTGLRPSVALENVGKQANLLMKEVDIILNEPFSSELYILKSKDDSMFDSQIQKNEPYSPIDNTIKNKYYAPEFFKPNPTISLAEYGKVLKSLFILNNSDLGSPYMWILFSQMFPVQKQLTYPDAPKLLTYK